MKKCRTCKETKDLRLFSVGRGECKECSRIRSRDWRRNNKERSIESSIKRNKKKIKRNQEFVFNYLINNPCVDCGENDPVVLEFDHQNSKKFLISNMIRSGYSIKSISEEIVKCEVRCANCHRRKTARDYNWFPWVRGQIGKAPRYERGVL